jgi:hypothetical protein
MGNIVWLASYPKSGNTWLRAFLANWLQDGERPLPLADLSRYAFDEALPAWYSDFVDDGDTTKLDAIGVTALRPRVHERLADLGSGSVFVKTHNMMGALGGIPLHNLAVTAGAIYVVRNPLDVVLSLADHFGLPVDDAISFLGEERTGTLNDHLFVSQMLGSWSTHVDSWTREPHPRYLTVRYEDMLDKPVKTFGRVLRHLNLASDARRLKQALRHADFRSLRAQEGREGFAERSPHAHNFFRAGRAGQWRTQLTRAQIDSVVARHGEQMARFGYLKGVR